MILYLNKQIKFDNNKLLILITLTVGSALLLYSALNNTSIKSYNSLQTLLGLTMATLCGLAITFYIIYSKKLAEEKQISAYQIMSVRFVALIILSLIFTPDLTTNIQNITLLQAGIFIAISIIGSVLPLLCLQLGFKYLKAIDISLTMS